MIDSGKLIGFILFQKVSGFRPAPCRRPGDGVKKTVHSRDSGVFRLLRALLYSDRARSFSVIKIRYRRFALAARKGLWG
jgi:hypothetical protein